jgi:hypothetical protein
MQYFDLFKNLLWHSDNPDTDLEDVVEAVLGKRTLTPEDLLIFKEKLENMQTGPKTLCKIILDSPTEFLGLGKVALHDRLYRLLERRRKKAGSFRRTQWKTPAWTKKRILECYRKIKENLREE